MKKLSKILLGTIFLILLFSTITSFNVVAVGDPDDTVEVPTFKSDGRKRKMFPNLESDYFNNKKE